MLGVLFQSTRPTTWRLSTGEVHVWRASLQQQAEQVQQLSQTLSADEWLRAERFHFESDQRRFIVARGLLRTILGCYLEVEPAQISFRYGAYGKPALAQPLCEATLSFNLSHAQELVLYALARQRQVGIDLEWITPLADVDQLAKSCLSAREWSLFQRLPELQKPERFFRTWTRKEAYLKAKGQGLALPLDQIEVSWLPTDTPQLVHSPALPEAAERWSLRDLDPGPGYVAALVVEGQGWQLSGWQWAN